jgi:hypothetical protein
MADNLTVRTDDGTHLVGTDEIAGIHYTRMKLILGVNGTNDGDVSTSNPMPVVITTPAPVKDYSSPDLNYYVLLGDGGTSTVTIEILNNTGVVFYKGALTVTTTAKSFDNWLSTATPTATFDSDDMVAARIYSVTGSPLLINTGGNGVAATNNGITSGMEPVSGAASRIPIGSYVSQYVGFGRGF